jgi:hypothetical protein
MASPWPHPPAPPDERGLIPQPAFLVRAAGLGVLAAGALTVTFGLLRASLWLVPFALLTAAGAALASWGAVVQFLGGEKVDDHPWV